MNKESLWKLSRLLGIVMDSQSKQLGYLMTVHLSTEALRVLSHSPEPIVSFLHYFHSVFLCFWPGVRVVGEVLGGKASCCKYSMFPCFSKHMWANSVQSLNYGFQKSHFSLPFSLFPFHSPSSFFSFCAYL